MALLKAIYDKQEDIPEEYQKLYTERKEKWELTEVSGVKTQTDVDTLQTSLRKERELHGDTKALLKPFKALDKTPEELHTELDRIPELEARAEGKGSDPEKIKAEVDAGVLKLMGPIDRELTELREGALVKDAKILDLTAAGTTRTIHDKVRAAAAELNVVASAVPDVLMLAERAFTVDTAEDGTQTVRTKDGSDPKLWLGDMQETRKHWWPESEGGGAGGSGGKGGFPENPFTRDHWNMTKQGQVFTKDPQRAAAMAKAAGTTVGGPKPPEKK